MIYRITSPDDKNTVAYAKTMADADKVAAIIIGNGYRVKVRRIKRQNVPLCEIEMVNML